MNRRKANKGRPKAFDEQEVLTTAMHYFWEHGYENTSLDNLLLAMGIKKSSFYATFKSKEEIFSRSLELYRNQNIQFLRKLKEEIGPKKTMLTLLHFSIKELQETGKVRGCLLMNSGKECYQRHEHLSRQVGLELSYITDLFTEFVREAQSLGEIKSEKAPEVIVGRYLNTLNGLVTTIQAGATQILIDDITEHLKEILE